MSRAIVLVGFAEALSAPESVWSLVDAGFQVVAFGRRGRASALRYSRLVECHEVTAPEENLAASLGDLSVLLDSLQNAWPDSRLVYCPLDDKAVWLGSKLTFGSAWISAGPRGLQASLALDKWVQTEMAREAGFNVPDTARVQTSADALDFANKVSFPIILKPAQCVPEYQGRFYVCRKWICANKSELDCAINEWKERVPLLAQTFITGVGEGAFGLAAPDGVRAWSGHHRVRMMNPQGSGSSACASQEVPEEIKVRGERLLANAGWHGLFMIELLRDDSGKLWFVELNGRPWGSMALCRRQNFEYPAWHIELALDRNTPAGSPGPGVTNLLCRHAGREFMHVLFVLKGAKSHALTKWPSFWSTLSEVLRFNRNDSLYNWRRDDLKVFAADFYYTVHDNIFKSRN